MKDVLSRLVPVPRNSRLRGGLFLWDELAKEQHQVDGLGPEDYTLEVGAGRIIIEASSGAGFYYAEMTLRQIKALSPSSCPGLEIEDAPVLRVRSYMLDISRCKVPSMEQLFRLVDLLAGFKYNQLQLYTEHTFAYAGHEEVWKESSPMTSAEIRQLRDYCAERFIELVPNQNAFGHMERWLKHERYRHLAESPDGFHHPVTGWRPTGTVLYPDQQAIRFIDNLLDQLLPNFSSEWVHLGCDEPWELGQGRSSDRSLEVGRHGLYHDYLQELYKLVQKRGMRMLFWSDELRPDPQRIRDFPDSMVPVVWGYEANHPFNDECSVYASLDRSFLIAPGDSSWNSFSGRLDTAFPNIKRAAEAAGENGAMGMLLTSWGDNGHQQVWPSQLPAIVVFSSAVWNSQGVDKMRLATAMDAFIFANADGGLGSFWERFAQLDSHIPIRILPENSSFSYDAFYQPHNKVAAAFRGQSNDCLFAAFNHLEECGKLLNRARPACGDADWLMDESRLAYDMTFAGMKRAESILKESPGLTDVVDLETIAQRFREAWLYRNRQGGLVESMERLQACPLAAR